MLRIVRQQWRGSVSGCGGLTAASSAATTTSLARPSPFPHPSRSILAPFNSTLPLHMPSGVHGAGYGSGGGTLVDEPFTADDDGPLAHPNRVMNLSVGAKGSVSTASKASISGNILNADDVLTLHKKFHVVTFAWLTPSAPAATTAGDAPPVAAKEFRSTATSKYDVVFFNPTDSTILYADSTDPASVPLVLKWLSDAKVIAHTPASSKNGEDAPHPSEVSTILYPAHPLRGQLIASSPLLVGIVGKGNSKILATDTTSLLIPEGQASPDTNIVLAKSAWEVVRGAFDAQQQVVIGAKPPVSFEHAYFDLEGGKYTCLVEKSLISVAADTARDALVSDASGSASSPAAAARVASAKAKGGAASAAKKATSNTISLNQGTLMDVNRPTPARLALLAYDSMKTLHTRFGTQGGKRRFTPEEHMIRAAIRVVNIFVVDCENKVQSGQVKNGITYASDVYSAQTKRSTMTQFRSLQDQSKRDMLTTLLFGEGQNAITLLLPSNRTKTHQLIFFARMCRPKCPYFACEPRMLVRYMSDPADADAMASFGSENTDPKRFWNEMVSRLPGGNSEEAVASKHMRLVRAATAFALSAANTRTDFNALALAAQTGKGIISAPQSMIQAFNEVSALSAVKSSGGGQSRTARTRNYVHSLTNAPAAAPPADGKAAVKKESIVSAIDQTYVNKVNLSDINAAKCLDEWKTRIYVSEPRKEREAKAVDAMRRYLVLDLETTTAKRYKRIANPFTGENWIVLSGARDYNGKIFMNTGEYFPQHVSQGYDNEEVLKLKRPAPGKIMPKWAIEGTSPDSLFLPPLDDYDIIVGHNIKFDMMQIWRDKELKKFLLRGGKIWDTLYGEYLVTGQQVRLGRGAGLEDVAKSYGGRTPKLDEVKQAWQQGKQTYDINPATLIEYLHGDLENTELIFKKHLVRLYDQRQAVIGAARMDSLLCTTEMEYNGLKTDLEIAVGQATQLNEKAAELERTIKSFIPSDIPPKLRKHWNWASNQHLALYFFGGPLQISTHSYDACKNLPKCGWARHTLSVRDRQPTNLSPPNLISGPAECSLLAGGYTSEKATKLSKSYLLPYFGEAGFRKSAPWNVSLSKEFMACKRKTGADAGASAPLSTGDGPALVTNVAAKASVLAKKKTVAEIQQEVADAMLARGVIEQAPLINLLPKRTLVLVVAGDKDHNQTSKECFTKLHVVNPYTKESLTIDVPPVAADTTPTNTTDMAPHAKQFEEFLLSQVRAHTVKIIDDQGLQNYFQAANVILLTRDAAFTFSNSMDSDVGGLKSIFDKYSGDRDSYDVNQLGDMVLSIADVNLALEFFRSYTTLPADQIPAAIASPTKRPSSAPFEDALDLPAELWCDEYGALLKECCHLQFAEEPISAKKLTKKQKEARAKDESTLPLLLQSQQTLRSKLPKVLSPDDLSKYEIMFVLGKALGTPFDPFLVQGFAKEVEIPISGRLQSYIPEKGTAIAIMEKFRSPTTHALQVGTDTLKFFESSYKDPAAKAITNLRGMQKLIGTYYEFSEGSTGMVSLVHESDSCIHHELIHTKTNTGRLASANPNCQNIPKEDKSPLREMFISRFKNGVCIEADYSQLEVITLAALANDKQMIKDLQAKVDFHCKRVTMMRPDLNYDDVVKWAKKEKIPEYVTMRQQAKIFSFQRQYGAGVKMLSISTGLSDEQVRAMIEREREIYRECDTFAAMVTLSANAYDPAIQDGARNVQGQMLYKGMFPVITGTRYIFSESDLPAAISGNLGEFEKKTNFSPTHLKNYPVQGFAGEIVQIMLGRLWRHFVDNDNYGGRAYLTNTVHDCVWVDTTPDVTEQVAKDVDRIMSSAKDALNELWPEMKCVVDFPVDVVVGENMCHLRPLKEFPEIIQKQKERDEAAAKAAAADNLPQ